MGRFPTVIGSLLPNFLMSRHLFLFFFFFLIGTAFLGHFMGKKSLEPPSSSLLKTALHVSLGDQRLQLSHDLLRILLLKKALGMRPGDPVPHTQVSQVPTTGPLLGPALRSGSACPTRV